MAVTLVDLTFNLSDLIGEDFDERRTKVWIETNVENNVVVDPDGNTIRLGSAKVTLNPDGSGEFADLWATNSVGTNPTGWQYRVTVDYPRSSDRQRARWSSGWFSLTATTDLADVVDEQYVPPEYQGALITQLAALRDETAAIRDETAALVVEDLGTTDAQSAALIANDLSLTYAALQARIDATANLVLMGVI